MASNVGDEKRVWPKEGIGWVVVGLVVLGIALWFGLSTLVDLGRPAPGGSSYQAQQDQTNLLSVGFTVGLVVCGLVCLRFARSSGLGARVSPQAIRSGLVSNDDETRLNAAERLSWLGDADVPDLAFGLLADRVAAIRVQGMSTLGQSKQGRQKLVDLLSGADDAAALRADVLGWAPSHPMIWEYLLPAIKQASSPAAARELLLVAGGHESGMPWLQRPNSDQVFGWPNRCCNCGSPNPSVLFPMLASSSSEHNYKVTTVTARFNVPICDSCLGKSRWGPQCKLGSSGLMYLHVASGDFVADLLSGGSGWELENRSHWGGW
jgi:hypothetical protein